MNEGKNIHSGHRARMIEKFINNPDSFANHELLEILLFSSLPRVNTNFIAHDLLHTFGSLEKVFSASPEMLMSVKGIGKRSAAEIALIGKIIKRVEGEKKPPIKFGISFEHNKEIIVNRFKGCLDEKFIVFLLDEKLNNITDISYNGTAKEVSGDINEIAKSFAIFKPSFVIIAHNHPSGSVQPSYDDDKATAKFDILCSSHGIKLLDHVIVCGYNAFSYHISNKLKELRLKFDIDNILIKGLNE